MSTVPIAGNNLATVRGQSEDSQGWRRMAGVDVQSPPLRRLVGSQDRAAAGRPRACVPAVTQRPPPVDGRWHRQ